MTKIISVIVVAILALAVVTAGAIVLFGFPYEPNNPPTADDTGSTQSGIQQVVDANNEFAFDLYSKLNSDSTQEGKNMFYSPYSISTALAMTYEGAKGKTADEMKSVFHFPDDNILRPNSAAIYNEINKKDKSYELKTGNALWVQQDYPFLQDYLDLVETYYGGKASNVDFRTETEKTRQTINTFIEEQTNHKIKDLIPKDVLKPTTRLVLTNAIYFKGTWEWEFDKSDTKDRDFKITPDNIIQTPTMYMDPDKAEFNYASLDKLKILELPYKGDELSMLILLPKQETFHNHRTGEEIVYDYSLEDIEISYEKLKEYKSEMKETDLEAIYIPKFEFDTKYMMKETLAAMGMPTAFGIQSDFSGMTLESQLFISQVIHQAYVKVDEKGTEAAAATAVVMDMASVGPTEPKIFKADHPFIFIIQEKQTGNILFMGKVINPSA